MVRFSEEKNMTPGCHGRDIRMLRREKREIKFF